MVGFERGFLVFSRARSLISSWSHRWLAVEPSERRPFDMVMPYAAEGVGESGAVDRYADWLPPDLDPGVPSSYTIRHIMRSWESSFS